MTNQKDLNPIAQAMDLWEVVLHRKWTVLLIGMVLAVGGVIAISFLPNSYASSITVLVDPQKIPERYVSDSVTMDQLRFDTLSQQILSATRLQQVIDELHLYPELQDHLTHDEVIEYMRKNITVQERAGGDRNMSAFTITFKGGDPKLVARVATRLADSFIKWDLGAREHQAFETSRFLDTQLAEAKRDMDEQDAKLSEFKMRHLGELPDQLRPYGGSLNRLQQKLQANTDALNRLDGEKLVMLHEGDPAVSSAGTGTKSERQRLSQERWKLEEKLANLRTRYSEEYPEVTQAKVELEDVTKRLQVASSEPVDTAATNTIDGARLEKLSREISLRQEEQKRLLAEIRQSESREYGAPLREQQLADLVRESQNAKAHYQSLVEKSYSAGIATELERKHATERFIVLDPARVPEKPLKPNRRRLAALLIPCCFLFSAGAVVLFERAVGTINTEHQLRSLLPGQVGIVGWIPLIETPTLARQRMRLQLAAIAGSLFCCLAVVTFLWRMHFHN